MKLLLDTHVFIWMDSASTKLSPTARSLIADRNNVLLLSVATIWEMQIKSMSGKLKLRVPLPQLVSDSESVNGLIVAQVSPAHVYGVQQLPPAHHDPFDRLLASVAISEIASLISADPVFQKYPVSTAW